MLVKPKLSLLILISWPISAHAQGPYAPAAGGIGSTALPYNDPSLISWASGWLDYISGDGVSLEWQKPEETIGASTANNFDVTSLGAGGSITLTFDSPITNGAGYDFAVFENSNVPGFLELAYVEVSTDGENFYRFGSDYLGTEPIGPFENSVDPTNVNGLAGKYLLGFGTPFDLDLLSNVEEVSADLDLNQINFVRIVDVVGDGSSLDTSGDPIYDPYPTFGSVGFDLDAVGVINEYVELDFLNVWFIEKTPDLKVGWDGVADETYYIQSSNDLEEWTTEAMVTGVADTNSYIITKTSEPFFIRIGTAAK